MGAPFSRGVGDALISASAMVKGPPSSTAKSEQNGWGRARNGNEAEERSSTAIGTMAVTQQSDEIAPTATVGRKHDQSRHPGDRVVLAVVAPRTNEERKACSP